MMSEANSLSAFSFHFKVNPAEIVYINAVLDSYEGLGVMRTLDEKSGHIVIYTVTPKPLTELLENLTQREGVIFTKYP